MEHNNKTHNQILLKNKNWAIKKKKKPNSSTSKKGK